MRRLLSILLLAAFVLPTVAPWLAAAQDPDAGLPACCRRHGAHHCAMNMEQMEKLGRSSSDPQVGAVCRFCPQHAVAPVAGRQVFTAHRGTASLALFARLTPVHRSDTQRRIARERSRHKRGPPARLLRIL